MPENQEKPKYKEWQYICAIMLLGLTIAGLAYGWEWLDHGRTVYEIRIEEPDGWTLVHYRHPIDGDPIAVDITKVKVVLEQTEVEPTPEWNARLKQAVDAKPHFSGF